MTPWNAGPALLFCPASRPDRFVKALDRADGVIIDLEDAVAPAQRPISRGALIESELDPARVIVRISAPGSAEFDADIATLSQTDYRTVMIAKAESPKRVGRIDPRFSVVVQCETARGISALERFAELKNVVALSWGSEDLIASLGGTSSRKANGRYRDVVRTARAKVLLAAGARGKLAIDAAYLDLANTRALRREAEDAAASGFAASACIHPDQVDIVRDAYRPDADAIAWARSLLKAADVGGSVFTHEGKMIDEPVLQHARTLLKRATK